MLLIAIHGVAFCTDLALVRGTTPLVRGGGPLLMLGAGPGRAAGLFFPLRYVQWLHSTPTMLLLMALTSDLTSAQLGVAIAADVVTMATGMAATWTSGPVQRAHGSWGEGESGVGGSVGQGGERRAGDGGDKGGCNGRGHGSRPGLRVQRTVPVTATD